MFNMGIVGGINLASPIGSYACELVHIIRLQLEFVQIADPDFFA